MKTTRQAMLGGGKNLLQTGDDTIWGTGIQPTMVNPEAKGSQRSMANSGPIRQSNGLSN
jgi:hypothetical protein